MMPPVDSAGSSITRTLSEFVTGTPSASLPEEVRERARLHILDALGCMIGGPRVEPGRAILNLVERLACAGPVTLWATGQRVPMPHAAYANGYLNNVLDFDDTDLGHPATVVIPAALAAAEQVGASGEALIRAVVMGYEVYVRLTAALRASTERNKEFGGTSSTQLLGVFAATTAAGLLLGLDAAALASAYGVAAEHAPVPASLNGFVSQRPLSWMKNNTGWVCLGGVLSADLVRVGLFASPAIFDAAARLWMRVGSDRYFPERLVEGLGAHYHLLDVSIKPYPCCRYLHTTLDALGRILNDNHLNADDVAIVQVRSFTRLGDFQDFAPQTFVDAQFSTPYTAAMILRRVRPGLDWYDPALLKNGAIAATARKVRFVPDPQADELYFDFDQRVYPTTVSVELTNGVCYEASATIPLGDPRNFMTPDAVTAKFQGLTEPVLGARAARTLAERVATIDRLTSVAVLREGVYE